MKIIIFAIALLLITASSLPNNLAFAENNGLVLSGDSGFVIKKDGLRFLLSHALTDTKDSFWDQIKNTDTIGKYYKVKKSSNYFMCLIDYSSKYTFETHLLMELTPTGKLIKSQRFFHGHSACCWNNYYEGFNKTGNYFSLKTCGTGSGYCGSYLYIFKNILPQDQQKAIPESYWSTFGENAQSLNSILEFKGNQLVVHYELEIGKLDDSTNFNVDSTKRFDAKFYFKNNKWITPDSAKFDGLDVW
ncbi:MAG: hypothetical protein JWP12_2538 [Bacteroidetes bacterium]|nr:hypothetical protein [Bacteroidota bacterium]